MDITTRPEDLLRRTGDYDDLLALATAEHALAAYRHPADYGFLAMGAGFISGTVIQRRGAEVGLAWSPEVIVVSPVGSDDPRDWIGNMASAWRRRWDPYLAKCTIGYGWCAQLRRLSKHVLRSIRLLLERYPDAQLVVTGHSLGGALATPMVAYLAYHGIPVRVAYCHEPPRPGGTAFKAWYDSRFTLGVTPTWTVVQVVGGESDLVTRLPLRRLGARHVGMRVTHVDGEVLFGDTAWQEHRKANPVGWWQAMRFATRTLRAIRAHLGITMLEVLRRRAGKGGFDAEEEVRAGRE